MQVTRAVRVRRVVVGREDLSISTLINAVAVVAAGTLVAGAAQAADRERIHIVGSSTVFPYNQAVAEPFATVSGQPLPLLESTGTGGGMTTFCAGVGPDHPDITGASRAMTAAEWDLCRSNGVTDVTEAHIGSDGLSVVQAVGGPEFALTEAQIFQALAAEVEVDGAIVANPHQSWSDIDPSLPDNPIVVIGPPTTSGTRDAFIELVMHDGCDTFAAIAVLKPADPDRWAAVCSTLRADGPFIDAGENDALIVQRLQQDQVALGIFGFSFVYESQDTIRALPINGVEPDFETIADGSYPVSRPLFFYVKNGHRDVIPGLPAFLELYMTPEVLGAGGLLAARGMVPLPEAQMKATMDAVLNAAPFTRHGS